MRGESTRGTPYAAAGFQAMVVGLILCLGAKDAINPETSKNLVVAGMSLLPIGVLPLIIATIVDWLSTKTLPNYE